MPYKDPVKAAENQRKRSMKYYYKHRRKCLIKMKLFRENNKEYFSAHNKKYREIHKDRLSNIAKNYRESHKEYFKLHNKKNNMRLRTDKPIDVETIQLVYESNIKKFGKLTCYLCLKKIAFGNDSLDHKNPISRGGDNSRKNLGVTHISCNAKKNRMTDNEYLEKLKCRS